MGMLGHAAFVKSDGSVFAHVHPDGTMAMAAMVMANSNAPMNDPSHSTAKQTMPGMDMVSNGLPDTLSFPYGFPSPGLYRTFVQMKHGNTMATGVFDTEVPFCQLRDIDQRGLAMNIFTLSWSFLKRCSMHLETRILVSRTPEEVWGYLSDYSNVPQWDRGVGSVCHNPDTVPGVGFEFSTFGILDKRGTGTERGKMSYRVSKADPIEGATVQLTSSDGNARYFKRAEWRFRVDPAPEGAWITCARPTLRLGATLETI